MASVKPRSPAVQLCITGIPHKETAEGRILPAGAAKHHASSIESRPGASNRQRESAALIISWALASVE
jgi:hypothetical protein